MTSNLTIDHFEDELESAFPGCSILHTISFSTEDQLSAPIMVLQAVNAHGGHLEGLGLDRRGERLDCRLRLLGLRPQQVRNLCRCLADLGGVDQVRVEHQVRRAEPPQAS